VGYVVVLEAMRRCPRLRLLRRQPEWMDGTFLTPWGEEHNLLRGRRVSRATADLVDDASQEHTYYADGSFQFSRASESRGWVCQCRPASLGALASFIDDSLIDAG